MGINISGGAQLRTRWAMHASSETLQNLTKTKPFETSKLEIQMSDFEFAEYLIKPMENNISGRAQLRTR